MSNSDHYIIIGLLCQFPLKSKVCQYQLTSSFYSPERKFDVEIHNNQENNCIDRFSLSCPYLKLWNIKDEFKIVFL